MKKYSILLLTCISILSIPLSLVADGEEVYTIPIRGEIDRSLVVFLRRSVESAVQEEADAIIFDINTFGGRVDSALQITTLIGSADEIDTVAFVTTDPESTGVSWSAGALISFSADRIFMAPGTSMGAAAPVTMGAEGMEAASEKVVSAVRAQIAALAEKNGYNVSIARAMVDADLELREVFVNGELRVEDREEIEDLQRRSKSEGLSIEEGKVVSPAGKLLTLTAGEMERYGVSSGTLSDTGEVLDALGLGDAEVKSLDQSGADRAVGFLTGSAATSLFIIIGLVALFIEITSPGFGIPGTVAIACFAVVFASYALMGTVGSVELILFVIGLLLLILELFIIPGFGVAGILGITLIIGSLVLSMQEFVLPDFEWQKNLLRRNLLVVLLSTVSSFAIFALLAFSLPQIKLFNRLTLKEAQTADKGFTVQTAEDEKRLAGRKGKVLTTLRPVGRAEIDGEIVYVETEGEFVEPGEEIEVIEVSGNRVLVRRVKT